MQECRNAGMQECRNAECRNEELTNKLANYKPVGGTLFWRNGEMKIQKAIGSEEKEDANEN
jgi:hypothetical protein